MRETLAGRALDGKVRTFSIVDAERHALGATKVKLREMAVQVFLSTMLIDTLYAALAGDQLYRASEGWGSHAHTK